MGNVLGVNIFTFNCAEISLANIDSSSCLPRRSTFRSLQKHWKRLEAAKKDVQGKIELEERQEMTTMLEEVREWLQQVETIQTQFHKLNEQLSANNKCCFCPTTTTYSFGKDVANVQKEVLSLLDRKPEIVTQRSLVERPAEIPVDEIIGMRSTQDEVWSYMEDEKLGIIALHGMGGVGKTTLMTGLHNKLCKSAHTFDVVFWIVISSAPNLSTVQNDIGRKLGFHTDDWKAKSQHDKATDIYNILMQKKYVLFLDDVWQGFDLIKLGVPRPDQANKSKIVLSTRSTEVCGNMEVNQKIKVSCLKEEEAWNLFRKKVGENTINAHPHILEIAKLVAKECDGLPLALIVIGRTMASKTTPRAWNTALNRLKKHTAEFIGMEDHVLPLLKFSYDNLPNPDIKSCFLYCSLYPEDFKIEKDDIIDKWICEGFVDGFVDFHEARNEGYEYIDTLVNVNLLEESSDLQHIKMHDIIREMAIWIGCECGVIKNKFFVRARVGLTEIPNLAECEGSERMSLMVNRIGELNGKPNCPNLVTLFLNEAKLTHIDDEFFHSMGKLRVLDLSRNVNLVKIPEEVCNLVNLQYLDLGYTRISKWPSNFHKLINLKWLTIRSNTSDTQKLREGVLSSFKKLQVLDLGGYYDDLPDTFVEEIGSLKDLGDLRITIKETGVRLSMFSSSSHKLTSITTLFKVIRTTSTNLDFIVSQKMMNLKDLFTEDCGQLEYVISSEIIGISINNYIQSLRYVRLNDCPLLKDITVFTFAPNLETVDIESCGGMKELSGEWKWEHTTPTLAFPKLKTLRLHGLPELERIYPNALPLFSCLKHLYVFNCPKLKKLPFNSSSCNSGRGVNIAGDKEWWNGLEWEDGPTRIAFLHTFGGW